MAQMLEGNTERGTMRKGTIAGIVVVVLLLLGALRGFNTSMLALRDGKWRGDDCPLGHDPEGKTLGILGMGGIGRDLKKKCEAFGMSTIYHNRHKLSDKDADGARYVSFDELLVRKLMDNCVPAVWHTC